MSGLHNSLLINDLVAVFRSGVSYGDTAYTMMLLHINREEFEDDKIVVISIGTGNIGALDYKKSKDMKKADWLQPALDMQCEGKSVVSLCLQTSCSFERVKALLVLAREAGCCSLVAIANMSDPLYLFVGDQ